MLRCDMTAAVDDLLSDIVLQLLAALLATRLQQGEALLIFVHYHARDEHGWWPLLRLLSILDDYNLG